MDIAVVGGSLGGLTAACLLADAGHDVTVYERSPAELEERGAGIGFLPATYRYLVEHGGFGSTRLPCAPVTSGISGAMARVVHDDAHRLPVQLVEHGLPPDARLLRPFGIPLGARVADARTRAA